MHKFTRSFRIAPDADRVSDVDPATPARIVVVLKPGAPVIPSRHVGGGFLSHADYASQHGSDAQAVAAVTRYAQSHGLIVAPHEAGSNQVVLTGTYGQAIAAFRPEQIGLYDNDGRRFVARTGHLFVPEEVAGQIVAVMGFDQRPIARAHFRMISPDAAATSYTPLQVASAYQFPTGLDGTGQTIALIELGGGYDDTQVASYFTSIGVTRTGTLTSVSVDGATNTPGDPNGADGEVQLDIEVAGSVAPGANIAVYFGPNQSSGFNDAIAAAVNDTANAPGIMSISWGGPEDSYAAQDLDAMNQTLAKAVALGITVCVASGDNGAGDGDTDGANHVDFPASSPNVLGCGGTSLPPGGPEVAWNDGAQGGASGGGYSTEFPVPSWQTGNTTAQRGVPDVAGDADPETGYTVSVDGTSAVIGGTSAVAPLWAGLIALVNQSAGKRSGFVNPTLYANPGAFTDITSGDNNGYTAAPGWDPVTGLGSPVGSAVLTALAGDGTPGS